MNLKFKNQTINDNSALAQTLAKLDEKTKPVKVALFIERFNSPVKLMDCIFQGIAGVRESIGKQSVIYDFICLKTDCVLDMKASRDTCYLTGEDDMPKIFMSYDIFNCEDMEKAKEAFFSALAQLIEYRIFKSTAKRFHWQLIYYLMGFDPVRAQMERAELKKVLGA